MRLPNISPFIFHPSDPAGIHLRLQDNVNLHCNTTVQFEFWDYRSCPVGVDIKKPNISVGFQIDHLEIRVPNVHHPHPPH